MLVHVMAEMLGFVLDVSMDKKKVQQTGIVWDLELEVDKAKHQTRNIYGRCSNHHHRRSACIPNLIASTNVAVVVAVF